MQRLSTIVSPDFPGYCIAIELGFDSFPRQRRCRMVTMDTTTGERMAAWWKRDGHRSTLTDDAARDIGERIRRVREEKGYRLKDFATMVGRDPSGVSNVERGIATVSLGALMQFAEVLGVPAAELLPGGFGTRDGEGYSLGFRHGYLHAIEVARQQIPPAP